MNTQRYLRGALLLIVFLPLLGMVCCSESQTRVEVKREPGDRAQWFSIDTVDDHLVVAVKRPWDTLVQRFVVCKKGEDVPQRLKYMKVLRVPVERLVCTSSTLVSFANQLGVVNSIVGISDIQFTFNKSIRDGQKRGTVVEIGQGSEYYFEEIVRVKPEIAVLSLFQDQLTQRFTDLGIETVPFADYLEATPLARLDWIRFAGVLFDRLDLANRYYDSISSNYSNLREKTKTISTRPTVFDGLPIEGTWWVSGGESYMAAMYRDAGADYIWKDLKGSASIAMPFEKVVADASTASFWRLVIAVPNKYTLSELMKTDERFSTFKATGNRGVIYCNSFLMPLFEEGVVVPDRVLSDLIFVFHPELLPGYQPLFYKTLL